MKQHNKEEFLTVTHFAYTSHKYSNKTLICLCPTRFTDSGPPLAL